MNTAPFPTIVQPASADAVRPAAVHPDRERLREVAQEFESLLILQMVKQMRQTFLEPDEEGKGLGAETMSETFDVELSRTLARQGGFGLAALIERGLDGRQGAAREPLPPAEPVGIRKAGAGFPKASRGADMTKLALPAERQPAPLDVPVAIKETSRAGATLALPLDAPVSSRFGWRADPFHGARRFHAGLDFRAAYGREVPVAAAGRVSFAGQQDGYGLTVVVDHENGVQTRYAHLSTIAVQAGQELAHGEVIGRVGQTGRATGPHLHFEVALDGRKVDPTLVAARVRGGLKSSTVDDDFPVERVPAGTAAMGE